MKYTDLNENDNFLRYPTNKLIGVVSTPEELQAAIVELNNAGFGEDAIDVLCGKKEPIDLMLPARNMELWRDCTGLSRSLETWKQ